MNSKKVAICGANHLWITYFLEALIHITGCEQLKKVSFSTNGMLYGNIVSNDTSIQLIAINGPYLDGKAAFQHLFRHADMVVYVVSTALPQNETSLMPYGTVDQKRYLAISMQYALQHSAMWPTLPWLWVATTDIPGYYQNTKIDIVCRNPLQQEIPAGQMMISCTLAQEADIERVWKAISAALYSNPT